MPKIKFKNIPTTARVRLCYKSYSCQQCPFDMKDADTKCMINSKYDLEEVVVELSEKDFPTNREWMGSLSNEDLALFLRSYGFGDQHPKTIEEWLSKPCTCLMEANTDAED